MTISLHLIFASTICDNGTSIFSSVGTPTSHYSIYESY